jgi:hypothetical protein
MSLETLITVMDVVFVVAGLQGIYSAIRVIKHHKRAEPMFWTQLMLGGISAVMFIGGLWHFLAVDVGV